MLSSVLNSDRAIQVNIEIMRTFTLLRSVRDSYHELEKKIADLEARSGAQFKAVFQAIRDLVVEKSESRKRIRGLSEK